MYSYVILMSLVCCRMSSVCHSYVLICHLYVLVCHAYVSSMYSQVIRMSLVCTRMSSVCHSYVLVCHPYVTRMHSYVIRMSLCVFVYSKIFGHFSLLSQNNRNKSHGTEWHWGWLTWSNKLFIILKWGLYLYCISHLVF